MLNLGNQIVVVLAVHRMDDADFGIAMELSFSHSTLARAHCPLGLLDTSSPAPFKRRLCVKIAAQVGS
jgi:hypothetical protein